MKPALLTGAMLLITTICLAQADTSFFSDLYFFNWCDEVQPQYPGGNKAMQKFLAKNAKYPVAAAKEGVSGEVILHFEIDTFGNTTNITVYKSVCYELDQEAIRLIGLLKGWTPYTFHGKKKNGYLSQPVLFQMDNHHKRRGKSKHKKATTFAGFIQLFNKKCYG